MVQTANIVQRLSWDGLIVWCDRYGIEHDEKFWSGDDWIKNEDKLRMELAEAMEVK